MSVIFPGLPPQNFFKKSSAIFELKFQYGFLVLILWSVVSSCKNNQETRESISSQWIHSSVETLEDCEQREGDWYKDLCWKKFFQEKYNPDEVTAYVDREIKKITAIEIQESGNTYPLIKTYAKQDPDGALLFLVYGDWLRPEEQRTLLFFLDNQAFDSAKPDPVVVTLFHGNAYAFETKAETDGNLFAQGNIPLNIIDRDNYTFSLSGDLSGVGEASLPSIVLKTTGMEVLTLTGMGNADVRVSGTEAIITGELGVLSYHILEELPTRHPEVTTLVLQDVSGSVNQAVNLHAGYIIRNAGYKTRIDSEGMVASGGVDLFLAGTERIVESGAKIGLHSWCCVNGISARNLPKPHPAHHDYLQYFTTLYGEKTGADIYYYIIDAADSDSIYWMTRKDIEKWGFATTLID